MSLQDEIDDMVPNYHYYIGIVLSRGLQWQKQPEAYDDDGSIDRAKLMLYVSLSLGEVTPQSMRPQVKIHPRMHCLDYTDSCLPHREGDDNKHKVALDWLHNA